MRREILLSLDDPEVDEYARALGVDTTGLKTVKAKVDLIDEARARSADVDALGMTVSIPIKRLHDLNVIDKLNGKALSDEDYKALCVDVLGEDQTRAIYDHCTDDDGTVDVEGVGLVLRKVFYSDAAKNF